jgi:hypothetical protein
MCVCVYVCLGGMRTGVVVFVDGDGETRAHFNRFRVYDDYGTVGGWKERCMHRRKQARARVYVYAKDAVQCVFAPSFVVLPCAKQGEKRETIKKCYLSVKGCWKIDETLSSYLLAKDKTRHRQGGIRTLILDDGEKCR